MLLKEFEGKSLLKQYSVTLPSCILFHKGDDLEQVKAVLDDRPFMIKAQTFSGGRGKAGLVKRYDRFSDAKVFISEIFHITHHGESIDEILFEECIVAQQEWYVSLSFCTETNTPTLVFSKSGGMDIESVDTSKVDHIPLSMESFEASSVLDRCSASLSDTERDFLLETLPKLYQCFTKNDCKLLEINPLFVTEKGLVAGDAKIILDDDAAFRHEWSFEKRTGQRRATDREIKAKEINDRDHRGVAGKTFIELGGDIAVLASGGGASVTAMDALFSYGAKPANYTEYSGNPPKEKVYELTKLTLTLPGLHGLWVVGSVANFTSIFDTLRGVMDALIEARPAFPIVIRRAGPEQEKAFAMVAEEAAKHGLDITLFDEKTAITESAKVIAKKAEAFANH